MALLQIESLRVEYRTSRGTSVVIPDFSLSIDAGEAFGLVGESGCGKSTLIMSILGYLGRNGHVTNGRILFDGQNLVGASEATLRAIRGSAIAIVYQEPATALNPSMTIGRQLMEVPLAHGQGSSAEARRRAMQVLADVHLPNPETVMARYPHQLSGGQKQRVVIAMALLANPKLLLLDEPTTGLDVTVEAAVLDLVNELREKYGTALLYISHNLGVIARVSDRIGVMYAGELVEETSSVALFADPRHPYTRGLLGAIPRLGADKTSAPLQPIAGAVLTAGTKRQGCSFFARCALALPGVCDAGPIRMYHYDAAHRVRCVRYGEASVLGSAAVEEIVATQVDDSVLLEAADLTKVFNLGRARLMANDELRFAARRGRVLAIVGESGSGKSTFARVLAGLDKASRGGLRFAGAEIGKTEVKQRSAEQVAAIQMVFQNPDGTLNPSHAVGMPIARALRQFGVARRGRDIETRVESLLELVRLPAAMRHALPRQLSGGQKQRIAIARAFAGNPALLIADEPVSALDVSVQAAVVNLLLRIQAEQQTTMVFISHDLSLVRYLADEVVVMYLGRVMESGPVEAIFAPPYHPYTEALLSAVPVPDPTVKQKRIRLEGEIGSALNPGPGCRFASRCPRKLGTVCDTTPPPVREAATGHLIACHIPVDRLRAVEPILERA
jgi:peptide/nickel transport system ATP-binding protein